MTFMRIRWMLPLIACAAGLGQSAGESIFGPLTVYDGAWTVTIDGGKPDSLVNRCNAGMAFYTCEQVVNGTPVALLIFTAASKTGKFDVDNVLPNGHASSDTDLIIEGNRWTFLTHGGAGGKLSFKVENTFRGRDTIQFETFSTEDDGKSWKKVGGGTTVRLKGASVTNP
jgi:hypothetical protein